MSGFRPESLRTGKAGERGGGQVNGWGMDILRRDRHTTQQLDVQCASYVYMQTVRQSHTGRNLRLGKIIKGLGSCLVMAKKMAFYVKTILFENNRRCSG